MGDSLTDLVGKVRHQGLPHLASVADHDGHRPLPAAGAVTSPAVLSPSQGGGSVFQMTLTDLPKVCTVHSA